MTLSIELDKHEIDHIRHALYVLRDSYREHLRLCRDTPTQKAERDAERFNQLISRSLNIDEKFSEAVNASRS